MNAKTTLTVFLIAGLAILLTAPALADPGTEPPQQVADYEAPPRPGDGVHMALTVEKLQNGFDPPRPLVIWAIGSSFTNALGSGDQLVGFIRDRFPDAPEIVYKKMAGCSTSYHFLRGWARHLVIPEQPDVVLIYNFGRTEELEKVIVDLRRHTTADIIVPTLHWCVPHKPVWPDPDARNSHQDPPALREMCGEHGVEFVESRRELTEYMTANRLEIDDLLGDSVHQNREAARMINMNIARHFHRADAPSYDPRSRERRLEVEASPSVDPSKTGWTLTADGRALTTSDKGASLTVRFRGNRIDLIGRRSAEGGTVDVEIDGGAADRADVFYAGYVQPDNKNVPKPPMPPRDRSPHAVGLGPGLVPQEWTIRMTGDEGDFELLGSLTGPDGRGNAFQPFTSNSGQIRIDPELWRAADTNRTGDRFTFEVYRPAVAEVPLAGEAGEKFRVRLIENLPNGPHTLVLTARGDGPVTIDALDVFEPPLE